jgi:putative ABC transport system substrate-binding protein
MNTRREFINLLGGAVVTWPILARAQQPTQMRRIGILLNQAPDDPLSLPRLTAFTQELQRLGWTADDNVRIEKRWSSGELRLIRRYATELAALLPDVLVTGGSGHVGALQEVTRKIPIVFVQTTDPIGSGLAASMARPGGNATGFTQFEYGMAAKWLELLKDIAPRVTRAAVIRNPTSPGGTGQLGAIQSVARSFAVELSAIDVREAGELERSIATFARVPGGGGMIVTSNALAGRHRDLIISGAAKYKLPTVYFSRGFVTEGGLVSYGPDIVNQWRRAAGYVDRILKGEKPADLPIQAPTKYELVVNLKTAKALGLTVPPMLLTRADEVIE